MFENLKKYTTYKLDILTTEYSGFTRYIKFYNFKNTLGIVRSSKVKPSLQIIVIPFKLFIGVNSVYTIISSKFNLIHTI